MPNRIIKESVCTSENIDKLTAYQETVFYRLMVNCDDFGRMDARPMILAARLYPLREKQSVRIEDALNALANADLITLYEVDGKPYLQMKTWEKHQQIRSKRSKYPSPDEGVCKQMISNDIKCNQAQADDSKCPRNPIQSESNPNPNTNTDSSAKTRFTPPTLEEVENYCKERNSGVDAKKFYDYYQEGKWHDSQGKPVRNWKQKLLRWEKDEAPKQAQAQRMAKRGLERSEIDDSWAADIMNRPRA